MGDDQLANERNAEAPDHEAIEDHGVPVHLASLPFLHNGWAVVRSAAHGDAVQCVRLRARRQTIPGRCCAGTMP